MLRLAVTGTAPTATPPVGILRTVPPATIIIWTRQHRLHQGYCQVRVRQTSAVVRGFKALKKCSATCPTNGVKPLLKDPEPRAARLYTLPSHVFVLYANERHRTHQFHGSINMGCFFGGV